MIFFIEVKILTLFFSKKIKTLNLFHSGRILTKFKTLIIR